MRVSLYIQGNKVDLFNDETIDLKSSVQDVNDITKNTTDFTKNFKLPASNINNRVFKHYYDASIENTFDARTKVEATIELDGLVFRYGKLSLLKVDVKNGKPSAYDVVFYGNLVNIKDKVGEDYISELDLSALNHEFTDTNVQTGLTQGLFNEDIIYTLLAKKRYFYDSGDDHTETEEISNIAYHNSHGNIHGVRFNDLKPSVKLIKLIEAIETKYDLSFSRDFFGRSEFDKIYMWVDSDESGTDVSNEVDFDSGDTTYMNLTTNVGTFPVEYQGIDYVNFQHRIRIEPVNTTTEYKIKVFLNGSLFSETTHTGVSTQISTSYNFGYGFVNDTYEIRYEVEAPANFIYECELLNTKIVSEEGQDGEQDQTGENFYTYGSTQSTSGNLNLSSNLPKLKVIDFLKGLFQMFKLVVIQKNPKDDIYVNTLNDYYNEGEVYNLTDYVDTEKHGVERAKLLNQITYAFEEPETILNIEFENNTGLGYGDEEATLTTEDGEPLDGSSLEITVPFEQVVYERLTDINDDSETFVQYGAIIDDEQKATNISAHLHYAVLNNLGGKTISFIDSNESQVDLSIVYVPSHTLGFTAPLHSLIFGSEFSTYTGNLIENTLFKNWHSDYISSIFNIKRRTFNYTACNLPYRYLMSLNLNDVIQIKDEYFRINSFTSNLITNKVTFELINSFDNSLNSFNTDDVVIIARQQADTETVYITQLDDKDATKSDVGFGIDWITITESNNNLIINIDENDTGVERNMIVFVQNADKTKTKRIIIRQQKTPLTYGNTAVTWGSTNITFND